MGTVTDVFVDDGTGNPPVSVKQFIDDNFGFRYDKAW